MMKASRCRRSTAVPALGLAALSARAWVALPGSDELPRCRGLAPGAGVRALSTLGGDTGSQSQGARGVASAPGLGFCGSCFRLLSMALGARHLLRGVTALAAEKRVRRKRKAPAKSEKKIREEKREKGVLARDLAGALKVSNEDIRQRREERRKRKQKEREIAEFEADPIYNITEGPDAIDPNIFGAPFVWVQIGHILLGSVLLASALIGGQDVEFALFDLQGETLSTLRTSMLVMFVISFVNAVVTYIEEKNDGGKDKDALGWFFKGLLLGGVSSWQRIGRIQKVKKKERDAEIDQVIEALESQPDGTPQIFERVGEQGKILTPGELEEQKLLEDKSKDRLLKS
mmetsp:Transcript_39337/g.80470  ORF Transcript_39337/g.80470 Transcript_39337/m.80470 type:complete len:345 (-) Transcript_39337:178-1212(-)